MNFFIAILILIFFIAFKIYQRVKVPEGLENAATLSFLDIIIAIYNKEGPDRRWEATREIIEKEGIAKVLFFLCDLTIPNIKEKVF